MYCNNLFVKFISRMPVTLDLRFKLYSSMRSDNPEIKIKIVIIKTLQRVKCCSPERCWQNNAVCVEGTAKIVFPIWREKAST